MERSSLVFRGYFTTVLILCLVIARASCISGALGPTVTTDLLGVNSDVTMHIISSLSSMDEANRLFAISVCGGN